MSMHSQSKPALAMVSAEKALFIESQPPMVCWPARHLASAAFFLIGRPSALVVGPTLAGARGGGRLASRAYGRTVPAKRERNHMAAYIVFTREKMRDAEEFKVYSGKAGGTMAGHQ